MSSVSLGLLGGTASPQQKDAADREFGPLAEAGLEPRRHARPRGEIKVQPQGRARTASARRDAAFDALDMGKNYEASARPCAVPCRHARLRPGRGIQMPRANAQGPATPRPVPGPSTTRLASGSGLPAADLFEMFRAKARPPHASACASKSFDDPTTCSRPELREHKMRKAARHDPSRKYGQRDLVPVDRARPPAKYRRARRGGAALTRWSPAIASSIVANSAGLDDREGTRRRIGFAQQGKTGVGAADIRRSVREKRSIVGVSVGLDRRSRLLSNIRCPASAGPMGLRQYNAKGAFRHTVHHLCT